MFDRLGAIPLSSDILTKANIGLWAFELDEGKEPRMYVDTAMLSLLGLEHQVSPEETYHAWYDHIDKDSYSLVAEAVEKMTNGEHAEVQYPWHHPNGTTMIVRCGGVRNPEYTKGIRIEGTHQNVTEVLHFEDENRIKEYQEFLVLVASTLAEEYATMYYINAEDGSYYVISKDSVFEKNIIDKLSRGADFYTDTAKSMNGLVYEEDFGVVEVLTDKEKMLAAFGDKDSFSIQYRAYIDGVPVWYKIKAVKLYRNGQLNYVLGVCRIEEKVALQHKYEETLTFTSYFLKAYESAYYVNLNDRSWTSFKRSEEIAKRYSIYKDYTDTLNLYIEEQVYPEYKELASILCDTEKIREKLKDKHGFNIILKSFIAGKDKYIRCEIIRGADKDHAAFGFMNVTDEVNEQQKRLMGALPLSPDILTKANIGLWAFELDEGKEPRMYVDSAMLGLIGLDRQISPEETYHAWYDYIDENSYPLVADAVEKMINGEHAEVQYPWHHPNGTTFTVRCGGVRNYNYTGGVRIEGTHQNVSAVIHYQEEKIAEQDVFNRYFLDSYESAYYISLNTLDWQVYKRSEQFSENYPKHEDYVKSLGRYINNEVNPADREALLILINPAKLKKRLALQQNFNFVFRKKMTSPEDDEVFMQAEVVRGADENHFALGFRNVTEDEKNRRQQIVIDDLANQQRHIKAFGDMINAALWSMDISERDEVVDVYWSDEFRHMFGFTDVNDFPNTIEPWSSRLHPDDRKQSIDNFRSAIMSKDTENFVYDIKYRIKRKSGEYCWYHAVGRMEYNEDNSRRMYGIITDISSDKKLAEALVLAESASEAKTAFLFNMSHDIRTPMNAILGFADIAEKSANNPEKVADCHKKIKHSGTLLLSLINSVLEMSRIESGNAELNETPGNVDYCFANIDITMQELAKKKDIELSFEFGDIQDKYVYADFDRSNRVFINIISNAIKYTKKGGYVKVRCEQAGRQGDEFGIFRYTFEDNGIGMSEEFQKHLFEEFSRERNSVTSEVQGTGLGLSVVKAFVELMNGTIEYDSKQGVGTTFIVTLPFRLQRTEESTRYIDPTSGHVVDINMSDSNSGREFTLAGKRILLVEDNELNREIASYILSEEKIEVEEATDGTVAVEMLELKGPEYYDFVLMDIQMPIMNGYEATKAIRKKYPDASLPIIALSANAFEEDKKKSYEAGMNGHVAKPINAKELLEALAALAGGKE